MIKSIYPYILSFLLIACNESGPKKPGNDPVQIVPAPDSSLSSSTEEDSASFGSRMKKPETGGYDLNHPEIFFLPDALNEVSGIAFYRGNSDTVFAEQDEDGRLYFLHPGDKKAASLKFAGGGDYEDLAILHEQIIFLRSDGVLFSFPFDQVREGKIRDVKKWKDLLPSGEFEGLYADPANNKIYVLCKICNDDNTKESVTAYILQLNANGEFVQSGTESINVKSIDKLTGEKKMKFHPSALARHPQTGEWYILSSVNKMLVITDKNWQVKNVYPLDPSLFNQPEGIAFDSNNNLYISNEGDKITKSNLLRFVLKK